jgi:hypothetical protein
MGAAMSRDHMTADEAGRRLDSVFLLGGTPDERRHAVRQFKEACLRESAQQHAQDNRKAAKALSGQ